MTPAEDALQAEIIGLTPPAASDVLVNRGFSVRVVSEDGDSFMVTSDWRPERINVAVEKGVITGIVSRG